MIAGARASAAALAAVSASSAVVVRVRGGRQGLLEAPRVPVRRQAERAVVLLRSADVPRNVRRRNPVVELRGGELLVGPVAAGGVADRAAPVVRDHHVRRVVGVDPEVVEVDVGAVVDDLVGGPAVGGAEERGVLHVHHVLVVMVGKDVRVVERPLPDAPLVVDELPGGARVVRTEEALRRRARRGRRPGWNWRLTPPPRSGPRRPRAASPDFGSSRSTCSRRRRS